ncbi:hypothetical protein KFE25_009802 [Diacronema lutheri]|uniref:PROP1-like PPR domain-containing protein n=1 Tax=Diacronema lutheri TaxID=2081491 RepID=A0A8J6C6Z9_DIALT|nr:hypothetical protein KFE25_009802 [Diacronema lutheri]
MARRVVIISAALAALAGSGVRAWTASISSRARLSPCMEPRCSARAAVAGDDDAGEDVGAPMRTPPARRPARQPPATARAAGASIDAEIWGAPSRDGSASPPNRRPAALSDDDAPVERWPPAERRPPAARGPPPRGQRRADAPVGARAGGRSRTAPTERAYAPAPPVFAGSSADRGADDDIDDDISANGSLRARGGRGGAPGGALDADDDVDTGLEAERELTEGEQQQYEQDAFGLAFDLEAAERGDADADDVDADDDQAGGRPGGGAPVAADGELRALHAELQAALDGARAAAAPQLLRDAASRGVNADSHAYTLALIACGRVGLTHVAFDLLDEAESAGIEPSRPMLTAALAACARTAHWQEATALISRLAAADEPPGAHPYALALRACAAARQPQRALDLHTAMLGAGVRPTVRTYGALLSALAEWDGGAGAARDSAVTTVRALLLEMRVEHAIQPDAYCAMAALRAMGNARDWRAAVELVDALRAGADAALTEDAGAAARARRAERAREDGEGAEGALLDDDVERVDAARAARVGTRVRARPPALGTSVYTAAIGVCARAGQLRSAERLFAWMRADRVAPTAATIAALVGGCAFDGEWRRALELLDELEAIDGGEAVTTSPSAIYAYSGALRACARAREYAEVLYLFDRIRQQGLRPDGYCYHQVVLACEHAGTVRRVRELLDEMRADGVRGNVFVNTAAVQVFAAKGAFNAALQLLDEMCADGPRPTVVTYNVLLRGLLVREQIETAKQVIKQMPKLGVQPDGYSHSMLANALAAGGQAAEAAKYVAKLPADLVSPRTYHGLVVSLCQAGEPRLALEQLGVMRRAGLAPEPRTMRLLLDEFSGELGGE